MKSFGSPKNLISAPVIISLSGLFLFLALGGLKTASLIFAWVAAVPLLFLVYRSASSARAFWYSWLVGFLFFAAQISWFLSAAPLDWAGAENPALGYVIMGIVWLSSAAVLGFFIGLFGFSLKKFAVGSWWYIAPSLLVLTEYAKSWGFGLWTMGKESLLGPYWTLGHLGYAAIYFKPLLHLSKFIGLYGLSFLFVAVSVLVFYAILRVTDRSRGANLNLRASGILIVFLIMSPAGLYVVSQNSGAPKDFRHVALIQTNFQQQFQFSETAFLSRALGNIEKVKKALGEFPETDIVVLPEGSLVTTYWKNNAPEEVKKLAAPGHKFLLIDAVKLVLNTPSPERIFYLDSEKGLVAYKDKNFLIPGGEYIPYVVRPFIWILGLDGWLSGFMASRGYAAPETPPSNLNGDLQKEGVLACSGILSINLYNDLVRNGAEILINTASQSTFRGNTLFLTQSENMIRFTAASQDRYFLQAANGGLNYIIDNNGLISKKSSGLGFGVLAGEIGYRNTRHPSAVFPAWPVAFSALVVAIAISLRIRRLWISLFRKPVV